MCLNASGILYHNKSALVKKMVNMSDVNFSGIVAHQIWYKGGCINKNTRENSVNTLNLSQFS